MTGLEPVRPFGHQILSLRCLPIPPHRHIVNSLKEIQNPKENQSRIGFLGGLGLLLRRNYSSPTKRLIIVKSLTFQAPVALLGLARSASYLTIR